MGWEDALGLGSGAKIWKSEYTMDIGSGTKAITPGTWTAADLLGKTVYGTLPDPSLDTLTPGLAVIPPGSIIFSHVPGISFLEESAGGSGGGSGGTTSGAEDTSGTTELEEFTDVVWLPDEVNVLDETTTIEEDKFYRLTGLALSQNLSTKFTNCLDSDMMSGFPGYYNPTPVDGALGGPEYWLGMELVIYDYNWSSDGDAGVTEPLGVVDFIPMGDRDDWDPDTGGTSDDPWNEFNARASGSIGLSAIDYDAHYVDPDQGKFRHDNDIKMFAHSSSPRFALADPDYEVNGSIEYGLTSYTTEHPWSYAEQEEFGLNEKFGFAYSGYDEIEESVTARLETLMLEFVESMRVGVIPRKDTTRRVPTPHVTNEMLEKIVGKEIKETMKIDGITSHPTSTSGATKYSSVVTAKIDDAGSY